MNILLISYYNPLGKGGFEKQTIGLFKSLVEEGNQVACLTVASPQQADTIKLQLELSKIFTLGTWVISHQEKGYNKEAQICFWLNSNTSAFLLQQNQFLCNLIKETIKEITNRSQIDIIHIHGLKTSYVMPNISYIPIIIDLLDSFSLHKKRKIIYSIKNEGSKVVGSLIDYFKTLKIEKSVLKVYAEKCPIVAISKIDCEIFQKLCSRAKVYVIPAGIFHRKSQEEFREHQIQEKLITFHGFMNQLHNLDTLRFLVNKILPIVHQEHPDLKLSITGLYLSDEVYGLADKFDWIKVFPSVDNITEFISKATLTCWPFRYGSGVKTKILESMVLGKPVVTTTIGSEALTVSQTKGILIADNAQRLAQHVTYLLSNPEECIRLGAMNRQVAMSEFTWEKRAKDYTRLYISTINTASKTS